MAAESSKITFQSAPRERGESPLTHDETTAKASFNPRPASGAKEHDQRSVPSLWRFNPRPASGAKDRVAGAVQRRCGVSIRAPRAGRKFSHNGGLIYHCGFQSAPRERGESTINGWRWQVSLVSIRAPRAGRKQVQVEKGLAVVAFQSAPRERGERWCAFARSTIALCFNPRPASGAKEQRPAAQAM